MTDTRMAPPANLVSIRIISDDVTRLAEFYELVTGTAAQWLTPDFAELATPAGTLALGSTRTVALFGAGPSRPADNHTAIIEFLVDDETPTMTGSGTCRSSSSTSRRPCRGATGP